MDTLLFEHYFFNIMYNASKGIHRYRPDGGRAFLPSPHPSVGASSINTPMKKNSEKILMSDKILIL
jgi:hypothetical protein